jgi:hypothetical protein
MMVFAVMVLKMVAWIFTLLSGAKSDLKGMLLHAGGITLLLTAADKVSVASNLGMQAILLTLALYGLMSFTLLPITWKVRKPAVTIALNLFGALGAFAGVNFTMDFLRGILP